MLHLDLETAEVHEGLMHAGLTWQREKIRKLVEAGGVGPALAPHSKQLIDSANLKSVMISIIFKSWPIRSQNGLALGTCPLPEAFPHLATGICHPSTLKCT
jgi:hypothetical protein